MAISDLPAIMGTILIFVGIVMAGVFAWRRTEGSDRSTQAGALMIVVGAVLLGVSLFVPHGK